MRLLLLLLIASAPRLCAPILHAQSASDTTALFPAQLDGDRWGYIDRTGTVVIPADFSAAYAFVGNRARVRANGGVRYIDRTGARVGSSYDDGYNFAGGYARVVEGRTAARRIAFIDTTGAQITPFRFAQATAFEQGVAAVREPSVLLRSWYLLGDSGNRLSRRYNQAVQPSEGLVAVQAYTQFIFIRIPRKWGYVNLAGESVIEPAFDVAFRFSEGLAAAVQDNRLGYIDTTGAWVISAQYLNGGPFAQGRARVRTPEGWGYLDPSGAFPIPVAYDEAMDFSEGFAAVQQAGRWQFIDREGRTPFPGRFDFVQAYRNGLAFVRDGAREGYIDRTGAFVWERERRAPQP